MKYAKSPIVYTITTEASPLWKSNRGTFCATGGVKVSPALGDNIHLHLLSDEPIEKYDWFYNNSTNSIHQAGEYADIVHSSKYDQSHISKIIATTDKSLKIVIPYHNDFDRECSLPQLSIDFIREFIHLQGKIKFAEVKHEWCFTDALGKTEYMEHQDKWTKEPTQIEIDFYEGRLFSRPTVNSENIIITKSLIKQYSQSEVEELCKKAFVDGKNQAIVNDAPGIVYYEDENSWVKENI